MNIPNGESLSYGALLTAVLASRMLDGSVSGYFYAAGLLLAGVPIAFLFLMYSNPKQQSNFNVGILIAFPVCAILFPVLGIAMLANKPWNNPQWKNRTAIHSEDRSNPPHEDAT